MKRRPCECGNPKQPGAEACDRCLMLDGGGVQDWTLIDALRNLGGTATTEAVMLETGWSYRQVRRAAAELERTGRVVRLETREEQHVNMPTLLLADRQRAPLRRRPWRQLTLPRVRRFLEPAGSPPIMASMRRRHRRRWRAQTMMQLRLLDPEPARAAA